jgi:UDPglucose 6-dehydrogenase
MRIAVVGTGYVGLVTGTCFSEMGVHVTCVDVDENKINGLKQGVIPIYEPGLETLVHKNVRSGRLNFTTRLEDVLNDVDIVFSAVGTPPDEDGSADLKYVLEVARTIGKHLNHYIVVVTKSTVPVGTAKKVKAVIEEELKKRGEQIEFDVASNPEFLKEGNAVKDFMSPDRVVVGVESERARKLMARLYKPFMIVSDRLIFTDIPSAEMIKYAANSMLATRISFMNDIANLCELVGADVNMVRKGIGSDTRIGKKLLYAGCGYGGSCFPKDVKALIRTAADNGYQMRVLQAVEDVNADQKLVLYRKLLAYYGSEEALMGKTVAMWGLAFKPETDDMREAPSLVLIDLLIKAGATVKVYDPVAMYECRRRIGDSVIYAKDLYDAADGADALMLVTEWKEFRMPNAKTLLQKMKGRLILDGRNILDHDELRQAGFEYHCIGR